MAADVVTSLGEFLRQERERRGLTIEQVASATKIGVKQLHALEADHFAELPAKPFVRGFVTSYTRFIGLEPKEVLTRFGHFIETKCHDRPNRDGGHSGYAFERKDGDQSRTVLWAVMGVSIAVGLLMVVVFKPALKHHKETHADKLRALHVKPTAGDTPVAMASSEPSPVPTPEKVAEKVPENAPEKKVAVVVTAAPSPTPAPAPKPDPINSGRDLTTKEIRHKIMVQALEDVWVRYRVDKKTPMKFILRKGRVLALHAKQMIRFQASDPSLLTLNYNSHGVVSGNDEPRLTRKQDTPTWYFPSEPSDNPDKPFPGENPLPAPAPRVEPAASSPTPETEPTASSPAPEEH